MSSVNKPVFAGVTHEGALSRVIGPEQALRRAVMTTLLWEKSFYEGGDSIAARIKALIPSVPAHIVAKIAIEAREESHLRHVPLFLVREMARYPSHKGYVESTLTRVIQRPDEITEFLAIYWKDGKCPIAASAKRGLAAAFNKFSEYSLAKYNQKDTIRLRDVMFLTHPKPSDGRKGFTKGFRNALSSKGVLNGALKPGELLFGKLASNALATPDTWEVELSKADGTSKKDKWTRLLNEEKLGVMALMRNLRNMAAAGVDDGIVRKHLREAKPDRVLPFRFLAALRAAPQYAGELETLMFKNLQNEAKLKGTTIIMVDVSGSMNANLSAQSDLDRRDAAAGLAIMLREVCEGVRVVSFANKTVEVPAYRGLGLAEAILKSQSGATHLYDAVVWANTQQYDRLVVITDEQANGRRAGEREGTPLEIPGPKHLGYIINVAMYKNGVGHGPWVSIDGWSERVVDFIRLNESTNM